jgi:hypothetical protein
MALPPLWEGDTESPPSQTYPLPCLGKIERTYPHLLTSCAFMSTSEAGFLLAIPHEPG